MEDDQQFCLKWNNHQSTLISQFDTLLENETLVDCTLAAEGKYLRAHKVVLSACSPYFESLLRLQYDKHPIFILKDVKYQELRAMIDYMYRGQVNISQDQLGALLKAAETLQIKGLSDSRTNEKKQPERVPSPPLPSSTKSSGPTISKPIVKPPPPDDDIADQNSPADRETSSSPTSRKRRRSRRHSNDESAVLPDNHELSNSSTHSEFVSHLSAQTSINRPNVTDRTENSSDTFQSPAIAKTSEKINVPKIKEIRKSEQHSELILEPKSEYVDEEGNDSVEDLTLEDEEMDDMDQSQAGPSHGGEGSSQGFAGWHNMGGDRTQDEVFMAAQDAAAGHRDSQERAHITATFGCFNLGLEDWKAIQQSYSPLQKLRKPVSKNAVLKLYNPILGLFVCMCGFRYKMSSDLLYHQRYECGRAFLCPCGKRNSRICNMKNHVRLFHPEQADEIIRQSMAHPIDVKDCKPMIDNNGTDKSENIESIPPPPPPPPQNF
ncbi:longitudinals lacking protein, isoforms A/B/D/L-like isoform X2 [Ctenocephalides felis]|uniref:longitudinals lacking protein, isoforms A/B/D/L-like isoform X2 n=1 Tax=Ctenocephalides felis TaxID=7515 RepID=UPI000E6E1E09|nr:longitudinals lacking protein, isoforms A/B/D/L-like isoform X2 [Ctenocephalides felis]